MKIYNTLSKKKEEFVPITPGEVKMYVCGPTVYNLIHIGNARPMIVFDTVRRYFEHKGYKVNYVSNFTDVDDKIIKKAIEEGVDSTVISERYIAECRKDMESLNVKPATTHPQATQEICGMLEMIEKLIEDGHAYAAADGTVYFRVRSFTASFPIKTWTIWKAASALCWFPVKIRRKIPWISSSGSLKKTESPIGNPPGATAVPAGTLNAPS